jgi:hypothetical protein
MTSQPMTLSPVCVISLFDRYVIDQILVYVVKLTLGKMGLGVFCRKFWRFL